jgi:hypothetical protein
MGPQLASLDTSIWRDLPQDIFRQHLVALEQRTNAVPADPQIFCMKDHEALASQDRIIPIETEQALADAFASVVAIEEGAQSVAAAAMQQNTNGTALLVTFAAVDTITQDVRTGLEDLRLHLAEAARNLLDSTKDIDRLLELITHLHFCRLLARLRSRKWTKPAYLARSHKKSLHLDFDNLVHRMQFTYQKNERAERGLVERRLKSLASLYASFEDVTDSAQEFEHMLRIVRVSYSCCKIDAVQDYVRRLATAGQTAQVKSALKTMRQVEKIGAYYKRSLTLIQAARRWPACFHYGRLQFQFLSPFQSIPTTVGYEDWAKTLHVHAEVQLVIHFDFEKYAKPCDGGDGEFLPPRVVGTSKYLCFLCCLFLKLHGKYPPANTHGRLYDQWTIPDLAEFDEEQRSRYRQIVHEMDQQVKYLSMMPPCYRVEPMTSRENLLGLDVSQSDEGEIVDVAHDLHHLHV